MKGIFLFLLIFVAACQTTGPTAVGHRGPPPMDGFEDPNQEFLRFFYLVQFHVEDKGRIDYLKRNDFPLRVKIYGGDDADIRDRVEKALAEIQQITGIDYRFVGLYEKPRNGIMEIRYGPRDENSRDAGFDANCHGQIHHAVSSNPGLITGTRIWLPSDMPWKIDRCIQEEIAQALGPPNDVSDFGERTLFNDLNTRSQKLTPWDRLALWILYDPRLKPGMHREDVMPIVEQILYEIGAW